MFGPDSTVAWESADPCLARFAAFVERSGIDVTIIDAGSHTQTVGQAAEALGVSDESILKSLLFHDGEGAFVIAIAAGERRIDPGLLAAQQGMSRAKLAKPDIVMQILGYPAGGVPPIGHSSQIPVVVDESAAMLATCYAGAGTLQHLARFDMADIIRLNDATIGPIARAGN